MSCYAGDWRGTALARITRHSNKAGAKVNEDFHKRAVKRLHEAAREIGLEPPRSNRKVPYKAERSVGAKRFLRIRIIRPRTAR
jgi:hypothetical protein